MVNPDTKFAEEDQEGPTTKTGDQEKSKEDKVRAYKRAGKIAFEVLHEKRTLVKRGARIIDICEATEQMIFDKGGKLAFPCNVSVDNIAAHYTSPFADVNVIPDDAKVCKLDIGVQIDGFIADTALTVCFDPEFERLADAAKKAFEAAIEIIRPGTSLQLIGERIEQVIKDDYGFLPLRELSGHLLDEYELHGPKILPNIALPFGKSEADIEEGEAYALETFATTGSGSVHDMINRHYIYSLLPTRSRLRSKTSRQIVSAIWKEYRTLPFSERRIMKEFNVPQVRLALRQLAAQKGVFEYNVLADIDGAYVAQYENTFIVTEDGVQITTQPPFEIDEERNEEEE